MFAKRLLPVKSEARARAGSTGLHQALHPPPARNEWGEDRGEGKPIKTHLLPSPLLHPMEEREKSRSLMQPCLLKEKAFLGIAPTRARAKLRRDLIKPRV